MKVIDVGNALDKFGDEAEYPIADYLVSFAKAHGEVPLAYKADRTNAYIATVKRGDSYEQAVRKAMKFWNAFGSGTKYYIKAQGRGKNRYERTIAAGYEYVSKPGVAQSLPLDAAEYVDLYVYTR